MNNDILITPEECNKLSHLNHNPGLAMWQICSNWRRQIEYSLKCNNITHPQLVILSTIAILSQSSSKISQTDIATRSNIDQATTSQIIRYLEKKKLIKRRYGKGNVKTKYTFLTQEGVDIVKKSIPVVESINSRFFHPLNNNFANFLEDLNILLEHSKVY